MRGLQGESSNGGGFWGLLFVVGWLLFGWPLVTIAGDGPGLFAFLFLGAGAVVAVLKAVSRHIGKGERQD